MDVRMIGEQLAAVSVDGIGDENPKWTLWRYAMSRLLLALSFIISAVAPGYSQTLSPDDLASRMIERRAVEAVIWGMPSADYNHLSRFFPSNVRAARLPRHPAPLAAREDTEPHPGPLRPGLRPMQAQ